MLAISSEWVSCYLKGIGTKIIHHIWIDNYHFRGRFVHIDCLPLLDESSSLRMLGRIFDGELGLNSTQRFDQEPSFQQKMIDQVLIGKPTLE